MTLGLVACSGGGGTPTATTTGGASAATGGAGSGSGGTIYVIGGKSDDPFWSKVKRGAEDAAKATGAKMQWLAPADYNNLGPDAAKLAQTALNQHATAVVGPDWVPEAQDPTWKQITQSGVPLVLYNSGGIDAAKKIGAINYVGSDEYPAGQAGGKYFADSGVKNVLCVNTLPGATNTEARCKGVADAQAAGGGKSTELPLPASNFGNPTAVTQAIKATLSRNTSIDGVITIGVSDADSAYSALQQANLVGKVKLGTFDENATQLGRIQSGDEAFAIDQQGYLQGFYAVSMAYQYVAWGMQLPTAPVPTGPVLITKTNVEQALAGAKVGVR